MPKMTSKQEKVVQNTECRLLRKETMSSVRTKLLTEDDVETVVEFAKKFYTQRLPLYKIFKVSVKDASAADKERVIIRIEDGASFGLFHKITGNLVGILMTEFCDRKKRYPPSFGSSQMSPGFIAMVRFIRFLKEDLCHVLDTDKYMALSMATMHPAYAGMDLLNACGLLRLAEEKGAESGCEYATSIVVSSYAQKAFGRIPGYVLLKEVNFADYVDPVTGDNPDLELSPIHRSAKVYYKRLFKGSYNSNQSKL